MEELVATTARPRWQRVLPSAAVLVVGAVGGVLIAFLAAAGFAVAADGCLSVVTLPILAVGALSMLAYVALGVAIGRWLPFAVIPPLLIVTLAVNVFYGDTEAYPDPPGWLLLWGSLQSVGIEFDPTGPPAGPTRTPCAAATAAASSVRRAGPLPLWSSW